jgi:hypothetical protein
MQVTHIHNFNYEGEENYVLIRVENNCINVIKKTRYGPPFLSNYTWMQYHTQNSIYDGKKEKRLALLQSISILHSSGRI